ncbi:MAG: methyltransferase domain-containing protein [Candidatus Limnocylindria bacterium]
MLSALARVRRRLPLAARVDACELLDGGCLTLPEVEANLMDLARLNRLPGGAATSVEAIERLSTGADGLTVLDAGTGYADLPLAFAARGWRTTAIDTHPDVLALARRQTSHEPLVTVLESDAGSLPFEEGAFDVAHCSLLLHHLRPHEAVTILRELARVARRGVVVNDLRRGIWPFAATAVTTALLARSGVTRSDGLTSARRAWTIAELDAFLAAAGLAVRWRSPAWMPRVVTAAVTSATA